MKFALFALLNTATALRFVGADLSEREENQLVHPTLVDNQVAGGLDHRPTFSQALDDLNSGAVHWDTQFRADAQEIRETHKPVVLQPSQDMLTRQEQMRLVKLANDELQIRHTAPLPDKVAPAAPIRTPKEQQYDAEMKHRMFPRFIDDKDFVDSRIDSDMINTVVGN